MVFFFFTQCRITFTVGRILRPQGHYLLLHFYSSGRESVVICDRSALAVLTSVLCYQGCVSLL